MAWTLVNALVSGTTATRAVTNTNLGNVRVVGVFSNSATATLGISAGGVTTWNPFGSGYNPTNPAGFTIRLFWGLITATGAQTITCTTSAGTIQEIVSGAFAPPACTVALDGTQTTTTGTTTTTGYGSQVPSTATDLYWGYAIYGASGAAGSTTGFTYFLTGTSNIALYSLAAPNPSAPTNPANAGGWGSVAGMLEVTSGALALPLQPEITRVPTMRSSVF